MVMTYYAKSKGSKSNGLKSLNTTIGCSIGGGVFKVVFGKDGIGAE
jgi:hypothetical protein